MADGSRTHSTKRDVYVTYEDLTDFRDELHRDSQSLRREFEAFAREIREHLTRRTETNWGTVIACATLVAVLAGMAGALINSAITSEAVARVTADANHREMNERQQHRIDELLRRELENAELRGEARQTFATLREQIHAGIENRKDIDAKHAAAQAALSARIDEVDHALDNGLGRRIDEKIGPLVERAIALEREVFGDQVNDRDMDRR